MQIHLLAVGQKMPRWIEEGFETYRKRLPRSLELVLSEIPPGRRTPSSGPEKALQSEGDRMLERILPGDRVIALAIEGSRWSTETLSLEVARWMQEGQRILLLVGGPDGLDSRLLRRSDQHWSLSSLTLPHPLVRVLIAEQLYRAHTLLSHHPYHR